MKDDVDVARMLEELVVPLLEMRVVVKERALR